MQEEASPHGSPTLPPAKCVATPCYLSLTVRNSHVQCLAFCWCSELAVGGSSGAEGCREHTWALAQHHGQDLFPVPPRGCSRYRPGQDVAQSNKAAPALRGAGAVIFASGTLVVTAGKGGESGLWPN